MNKLLKVVLTSVMILSVGATVASADAKKGQKYYLKKLKACKKDGLKTGHNFALKNDQKTWASIKADGKLVQEWIANCPSGEKKIKKMKEKDINNLYDFCYKYASDGDVPSCG